MSADDVGLPAHGALLPPPRQADQALSSVFGVPQHGNVVRGLQYGQKNTLVTGSALFLLLVLVCAIFAPFIAPHNPEALNLAASNLPPGSAVGGVSYLLGTDSVGHDILSQVIFGSRISMTVGVLSVLLSGSIGVILGLLAGYYRGWLDGVLMRLVDLQMSIPPLVLALFVLFTVGSSFLNIVLVLGLTRWMAYTRLVRGMMLSLRERQFFEGIVQLGANDVRVLLRHGLPNVMGPVAVLATLEVASVMLTEASLDFLGLGIQPPTPSWGVMIANGQDYLASAWWEVTMPGLAILLTALSLNILASRLSHTLGRADSR
jgi:peptide/nickel transport system permease protein